MSLVEDAVLLVIKIHGDTTGLTPALAEAKAQLAGVGVQADATAAQLARVGNASELTATKVDTASKATSTHASTSLAAAKSLSTIGLAFGGAGVAAGVYSAHVAAAFDEAGAHILAGTSTTVTQLQAIKAEALAMAVQTGMSATDLLKSYYSIASSVSNAATAQAIWTNSIKFGAAYQTDAITSTGLLTGVVNAYGAKTSQVAGLQDDLSTAVKIGAAEAGDLASAFANFDPIAAHMGVTVKTSGAAIAEMTNASVSAAEAGDRWKNLLQALDAPLPQQIKAVNALGGSYEDLRIHNGDVIATLQKLDALMHSATPSIQQISDATGLSANKAKIWAQEMSTADGKARLLFGGNQVAAQAFFSLMNDGGKQFSTNLQAMAHDSGTTEASFKIAMNNAQADANRARQALNVLAIEVGTTLLPQFIALEKQSIPVAHAIAGFAQQNPAATKTFFDLSAAALAVSLGTKGVISVWSGLAAGFSGGATAVQAAGQFMRDLGNGAVYTSPKLAAAGAEATAAGAEAEASAGGWAILSGAMKAAAGIGIIYAGIEIANSIKEAGNEKAIRDTAQAYAEGKISADKYNTVLSLLDGTQQAQIRALVDQDKAQLALNGHLDDGTQKTQARTKAVNDQITAYSKLSGMMGGVDALGIIGGTAGTWPYSPKANDNVTSPMFLDLQKQVSAAQAAVQHWANIVAYDRDKLHADNAAHDAELQKARSKLAELEVQESKLTSVTTTVHDSLKAAKAPLDTLTQMENERAMLEAKVQALMAAGLPVSQAYQNDIRSLSAEITKIQTYITGLENPTKKSADALAELAVAAEHGAEGLGGKDSGKAGIGPETGKGGTTPGESGKGTISYATPAGFGGLPRGALGAGSGGQAGGGGYTVGGNTISIPTSSQIANLPQNQVSGTITSPGIIPVSVVSLPSLAGNGGIQSLLSGTPVQAGQPTTVELKALQQLQSVMSAGNAVDSAKLTVLADTSKMNVDATNATTNAVQDQTSVLQAQAAVGTARSNATIAAINDETAVMSAQGQYAIDSLKSQQTIAADLKKYGPGAQVGLDVHLAAAIAKVDQDAIATDKAKETEDRALGLLQVKIASDGLKAAQDKAKADEVAAKFTQMVDKDKIAVDTANLAIARDNQQIALAQLGELVTLNKGQDDFTNLIAQAGSDNSAAGLATWQLGGDQSASDASAALYGGLMAGDAQQTALDQNDYATTQGAGDTQLAYLNQTQSQDSTQVSLLQQAVSGISQVASNTGSSGSIVDALKTAFDAIAAMTQTGGIGGNAGQGLTFNDMLNAVGAAVAVGLGQSLGSVAITRNP